MQVKITRSHFEKYSKMCKLFGLGIPDDQETFMGQSREGMRRCIADDKALNNIPLLSWDCAAGFLVSKPHTLTLEGTDDGPRFGCSLAEAVCCYKHLAIFHFASCVPDLKDTFQETR